MKRLIFVWGIVAILLVLTACDYDEKSLKGIEHDLPSEVTMDFELVEGEYAPIRYESSHPDVLKPMDDYTAKVFQQDEDVIVTLTARVNKTAKKIQIKVLKKGSDPTPREKVQLAKDQFQYPESVSENFTLPSTIDDVIIQYEIRRAHRYIKPNLVDGEYYINPSSYSTNANNEMEIKVYFNYYQDNRLLASKSELIFIEVIETTEETTG